MMTYKGYRAKVEFDEDANLLHGEVLGLKDVITFQADSASAVRAAFVDSVNDYLVFCKKRGEKPEKPASGKLLVRLRPQLHRDLSNLAQSEGKSINALIEEALNARVGSTHPAP